MKLHAVMHSVDLNVIDRDARKKEKKMIEITLDTAFCYLTISHDDRIKYRRLLTKEQGEQLVNKLHEIADRADLAADIVRKEVK